MTCPTLREIKDRLDDLDGDDDSLEVVITSHRVDSDGSSDVVDETRVWEDSDGWQSEQTDYRDEPHPEDGQEWDLP